MNCMSGKGVEWVGLDWWGCELREGCRGLEGIGAEKNPDWTEVVVTTQH